MTYLILIVTRWKRQGRPAFCLGGAGKLRLHPPDLLGLHPALAPSQIVMIRL